MRMYDIIKNKRDGKELSTAEIDFFIQNYTLERIPDYQASALLMAMFLQGMTSRETLDMTMAMVKSGDVVDLSAIDGITSDKHSTGGVGDKTTLIVAPIVSACGIKVAKMSGRGLGHTGGTIDKLESISGYQSELSELDFIRITNKVGLSIIGQTGNLVPADKKLYALRDVTATVDNLALIVSSIMSKKLAVNADSIVLDIKTGSGSFNKKLDNTIKMAQEMVNVGKGAGKKITAIITNMDVPLGKAIGNSLEIIEAVQTLQGKGSQDLTAVCLCLSAEMLYLSGKGSIDECYRLAQNAINNGSAYSQFVKMIQAHGGDIDQINNLDLLPKAKYNKQILSPKTAYIATMDTEKMGISAVILGAGRINKGDKIDYSAGIMLDKKTGDYVEKGDTLATIFSSDEHCLNDAEKMFLDALSFSDSQPQPFEMIMGRICSED